VHDSHTSSSAWRPAQAITAHLAGRVNMVSCQDFMDSLYEYSSGELPQARKVPLTDHLAGCPACQGELALYEQVIRLAHQLSGVSPPHHLLRRFQAAVQGVKPPPPEG
jgi:anti-sigma factor RsiW